MILRNKRPERIESFLRLECVELTTSRAGNQILVCYFRNNLNMKFRHYISANKRSQVWTSNILWGTNESSDFESILMKEEVFHEDPFEKARNKIFKVVWQYDKKYNSYTVNEIYDLSKNYIKKDVAEERYQNGYWRNLSTLKAGYARSLADWPYEYYMKKGGENEEN